jgi:membrane protease YdiL (CAAX protease family)
MVAICLILPTGLLLHALLPPASAHELAAVQRRLLESVLHPGWVVLVAGIVAPVLEEVIFRGWLLSLGRRYLPTWLAVLGSSAVFGAIHMARGPINAANAFVIGCLFAWLAIRTRSVFSGMIAHAASNLAGIFLVYPAFGITEYLLNASVSSIAAAPVTTLIAPGWTALSVVLAAVSLAILTRVTSAPADAAAARPGTTD